MIAICLTGPESSGKTTLAWQLAQHFRTVWLPEYARTYLTEPTYDQSDLSNITCEQFARETCFFASGARLAFLDTDVINLRIWWYLRMGYVPQAVERQLETQHKRSYLLLRPDIPWEIDPLRDANLDREDLFRRHEDELAHRGFSYEIVDGLQDDRVQRAIQATERLMAMNS